MVSARRTPDGKYNPRYMQEWREKNRTRLRLKERAKDRALRQKYGISLETFEALLSSQNNKCRICTAPLGDKGVLDHCHTTGKIRGILCRKCNSGIGQFGDRPELVEAAARYLREYVSS